MTAPDWVQLVDHEDGLVVVELDEAAARAAPLPGLGVQLAVTVPLADADPQGQPYDVEHAQLLRWRAALEQALGRDGRLVATITADGVREHVAYVRGEQVVAPWQSAPPPGLGAYEARVVLLADPDWRGLREIAGLLADDEEPLLLPDA